MTVFIQIGYVLLICVSNELINTHANRCLCCTFVFSETYDKRLKNFSQRFPYFYSNLFAISITDAQFGCESGFAPDRSIPPTEPLHRTRSREPNRNRNCLTICSSVRGTVPLIGSLWHWIGEFVN